MRNQLHTPSSVDVLFAHGGFTGPGSHPGPLYERLVDQKVYAYQKSELEDRAFYAVATSADVEDKWPRFLATHPDLVKIYLLYSERYSETNPAKVEGLRPELAREIVRRAKLAGIRAGAHVESARDFHNALLAKVDFVLHLPGYWPEKDAKYDDYVISRGDAELAAKQDTYVVATASILIRSTDEKAKRIQLENLQLLKAAGVKLLIGSDAVPGSGTQDEVEYLKATGIFSNLELLNLWCRDTPQAIFAQRKIGKLQNGYEANFLVLGADPLLDFTMMKNIKLSVKQGIIMDREKPNRKE